MLTFMATNYVTSDQTSVDQIVLLLTAILFLGLIAGLLLGRR
jgi:hypothetical protein